MIYLRTTLGLFLLGVLLGLFCAGVQYAGASLLFFCFALATVIVYSFDLRGKLAGVLAMDAGLIIGSVIRIAYWRSRHGFETLVDWNQTDLVVAAILISGMTRGVYFLIEKIWTAQKSSPPDTED